MEGMQGGQVPGSGARPVAGSLSERLESFMRTPAFLEALKQSLKRMIDLKLAQDQMTQSAARQAGLPLAADITGLFERVHSAEQAILSRLAQLEDRLTAMEAKLDSSRGPRRLQKGKSADQGCTDDAPRESRGLTPPCSEIGGIWHP